MGRKGGGEGKPTFKRFKGIAEVLVIISLYVTVGVSLKASSEVSAAAREANAAAEDANAAVREGNEITAGLGAFDAKASLRDRIPMVIISKATSGDGYVKATGWNPSQYPAIVVGAELEFEYGNTEGGSETSNLALETATKDSCQFELWSSGDGAASSEVFPCTEAVSVDPGDILWVSAAIPDAQKRIFCQRHPEGLVGFSIVSEHALDNVSDDLSEDLWAPEISCEGRSFEDPS